jgi:hypothetical protein
LHEFQGSKTKKSIIICLEKSRRGIPLPGTGRPPHPILAIPFGLYAALYAVMKKISGCGREQQRFTPLLRCPTLPMDIRGKHRTLAPANCVTRYSAMVHAQCCDRSLPGPVKTGNELFTLPTQFGADAVDMGIAVCESAFPFVGYRGGVPRDSSGPIRYSSHW